jgi:hypothetical protein
MFKKILILFLVFFSLFSAGQVQAQEPKQITIVNPIRGEDFWNYAYSILETPRKQYELINSKNIEATWMPRYDALKNSEVQTFLKNLNSKQEIGIFLEVTPTLANDAGVIYNQSENWHYAKSVLVIGYSQDDRKKLIDTVMSEYKKIFGKYPKSVGAWWIDAYSLQYMKDKYQIEVNMDVSDQFSTDGYQVWGQYWSSPFYPSKKNALMPASSENEKIGIVTIQWAGRDPFNGYGNGVFESTYSVQANDYMLHDLGIDYFAKLVTPYPQVTVGLENDFDWNKYGDEYSKQVDYISKLNDSQLVSMQNFGKNYRTSYPKISPKLTIFSDDALGSDGKVVWYQTDKYRVGLFVNAEGVVIRDLRQFNDGVEEACYAKACDSLKLGFSANQAIDEVNYGTRWVIDQGNVKDFKQEQTAEGLKISYLNGSNVVRTITFLANDIKVDDEIKTIATAILRAVETSQNSGQIVNQDEKDFISKVEWGKVLPKLLIDGFKFLIFTTLFLIIPGFVLSKRLLLALPVGIALFSLVSFVLSIFHIEILLWSIPVIFLAGGFYWRVRVQKPIIEKTDLIAWGIILIGSVSWLLTQVKNGLLFNYGFGYWGPNGHDAIWHLQLIGSLSQKIPPQNYVFSGQPLENYHYFYDLVLAQVVRLLGVDPQNLLFRLFPLILSLAIGLISYHLAVLLSKKLDYSDHKSKIAGIIAVFFVYFGGSLGWIVSFFKNGSFGGETTFWAQQSISTLLNPPFAVSLLLLMAGVYVYYSTDFSEKKQFINKGLILILLWGTLIEFKAYAGVLVLGALGIITLFKIFKKQLYFVIMSSLVLAISLIVFLPNNSSSNNLISFSPFWLVRSMLEFEDRLNWTRLLLTMQSGVWYKEWIAYFVAIVIFIVGNFGLRIISFASIKPYRKFGLLMLISLLGFIFPMLFLQAGTNWNIVQFFYYSLMIQAVFTGIVIARWLNRLPKIIGSIVILIVVLLTIPTSLNTLSQYLPKRPPAKLSIAESDALNMLSGMPMGVVLSPVYDEKLNKKFEAPKPLFVYTSTSYVSAFSKKPSFVEDTINLEILGVDYLSRINTTKEILKGTLNSHKLLVDNNIMYLYIPKLIGTKIDEGKLGVEKIYENDETLIYKIK